MDKAYFTSITKKDIWKALFQKSNLVRVSLLITSLVIYMLFLSPSVESLIQNIILGEIRASREITLNYLTPIVNNEIYSQDYSINTLSTTDLLKKVNSKTSIRTEDPRVIAMQKFLLAYNSPMYPYSKNFIEQADRYSLDWRLVASISGVESAFGNLVPRGTNNGWGWRGANPTAQGWSQFETWGHGIETVTSRLALGYGTTLTPFQIEPSYCPPCAANPAHAWANGVLRFMRELDYYVDNLDSF
jgi:hypothetical protein